MRGPEPPHRPAYARHRPARRANPSTDRRTTLRPCRLRLVTERLTTAGGCHVRGCDDEHGRDCPANQFELPLQTLPTLRGANFLDQSAELNQTSVKVSRLDSWSKRRTAFN